MTASTVADQIIIRPAVEGDFSWVADLMDRTLRPFYGGDHRAHARRIFETHIHGGIDYVGHFSAGQYMFIAEVNGEQVGLIHVVDKKQATVKISPLIVASGYRGNRGVGSALLAHAEAFARNLGARQLYCTVAHPNGSALGFFLRKGFRITGTARSHYKQGVDEHMLYKQLVADSTLDAPNVSVVPFDVSRHGESVRKLILTSMDHLFDGVDDAWVEALYAAYARRNSGEVNEKYKIVFVAECNGAVVGVAGATPKKGDPIKLMPLLAMDEAAFEALIVDLKGLLADYGHKLYTHIVPAAWQVLCLQRHGWVLEGVFPGGYAPDSVVQQWGLNMNKEGELTMRTMRIKRPYYDAIMRGDKTLEVRVGYDSIRKYRVGDLIELVTAQTAAVIKAKAIRTYETFAEMLAVEPWQQIVPDAPNQEAALRRLQEIYPNAKEALGVYVFEIEPVRRSGQ